ncbi:hypothetical protein [Limosilactobacillus reuteri]|uniref:hypothetical protein n=1 Tax=Limosilactobacillus reuteri TaxID=1598 RepID=UPI001E396DB9|nr:hypothetical protein [Limosilactobacillus reuteri]MCC4489893.1 hypothetical protein [Limosilactobacillus reuteri]MCC4494056.1 hypothetical protein [Limosilactobacillus reuteri]MCC4496547.1 hypothetical protein [Limosilactobacillus reuteri]
MALPGQVNYAGLADHLSNCLDDGLSQLFYVLTRHDNENDAPTMQLGHLPFAPIRVANPVGSVMFS